VQISDSEGEQKEREREHKEREREREHKEREREREHKEREREQKGREGEHAPEDREQEGEGGTHSRTELTDTTYTDEVCSDGEGEEEEEEDVFSVDTSRGQLSQRQHIINEILTTERDYINDLDYIIEVCYGYKRGGERGEWQGGRGKWERGKGEGEGEGEKILLFCCKTDICRWTKIRKVRYTTGNFSHIISPYSPSPFPFSSLFSSFFYLLSPSPLSSPLFSSFSFPFALPSPILHLFHLICFTFLAMWRVYVK
jgi:hypothetical protein